MVSQKREVYCQPSPRIADRGAGFAARVATLASIPEERVVILSAAGRIVRCRMPNVLQCLAAAVTYVNTMAVHFKQHGEAVCRIAVVIDDQNLAP